MNDVKMISNETKFDVSYSLILRLMRPYKILSIQVMIEDYYTKNIFKLVSIVEVVEVIE